MFICCPGMKSAIDTVTGTVYCHKCEDWVYAPLFETAAGRAKRLQEERLDWSISMSQDFCQAE